MSGKKINSEKDKLKRGNPEKEQKKWHFFKKESKKRKSEKGKLKKCNSEKEEL